MPTTKLTSKDPNEQAWFDHRDRLNALYDAKEAEMIAAGWRKHGLGRNRFYTQAGQKSVVIRRQLGSPVWYTCPKDF